MGVKLEGKDVMATWKLIMGAFILLPCLILYPIIAALVARYTHTKLSPTYAFAATALLQLPLMYASVRFVEIGWEVARSIKPLWLALIGHAGLHELRAERSELKRRVKGIVDVFGPQLVGDKFEQERVIKQSGELSREWSSSGVRKVSRDAEDKVADGGNEAEQDFQKSHFIRLRGRKELGFAA